MRLGTIVMNKHNHASGRRYRDGSTPARIRRRTEIEVIATKARVTTPDEVSRRVHEILLITVLVIIGAGVLLAILSS